MMFAGVKGMQSCNIIFTTEKVKHASWIQPLNISFEMLKRKGFNNECGKRNVITTVLNAKTQARGNETANHMKPA